MKKTEVYYGDVTVMGEFPTERLIATFDYEMKIVKKGADFCVGQTVYSVLDFQPATETQPAKVLVGL